MKNLMLKAFLILVSILFYGCAAIKSQDNQLQWDFDHQVQFREVKLDDNSYEIEVVANNNTHFEMLATFLIRRSMEICQAYGFTVTILKGVESVNDRLGLPNMIMPSLSARVVCPH